MKKQPLILTLSFLIAAIAALSFFSVKNLLYLNVAKDEMQTDFTASIEAVIDGTEGVAISMNKARNAVTDGFFITSLCEVQNEIRGVITALSVLPCKNDTTVALNALLARISDYAGALMKKAANGREITEEELQTLFELCSGVGTLGEKFASLRGEIESGNVNLCELFAFSEKSYGEDAISLTELLSQWESELSQFPSLNYDGKYSAHLDGAELLFLKDKADILPSELHSAAAELFGVGADELSDPVSRVGETGSCYSHGGITAEFSSSGHLISYISEGSCGEATVSLKEAEQTALEFAKKQGYEDMTANLSYTDNGVAVFELICVEEGVYFYGDGIKIGVSLCDGKVITFFASDYIKHHTDRDITFKHSREEAEALLENCEIIDCKKAVILSAGEREIPCYEFRVIPKNTAYGNGEHELLIYINADDLTEEEMILLYQTENGTTAIK
ncbi:MAG: germination protein YpeB [Clostridia bacterium]|nr:germination protein YpeB [Clostridia bacterium]